MQFYLAPMEAVTGFVYRNVYHSMFGDMDKYFAPFITPTQKKILRTRERKDVAPENNVGMYMVPQLLTNNSEQFIETCEFLARSGYREINLNLGCPAATVVTKGKGSGFLGETVKLERFFEEVFAWNETLPEEEKFAISVKTRLSLEDAEEFEEILPIYNQYPLKEVIIHPRVRRDFYKGTPDYDAFAKALEQCKHEVCYNGDIFTKEDYVNLTERFPNIDKIMLGRGIIANPGLVREIRTGKKITKEELHLYHDKLYEGYLADLGAEKDVLYKMKEMWFYLGTSFINSEKALKQIQKVKQPAEYKTAVKELWPLLEVK
ncbi:MAG: tRNA-dihydrouridine synthase family protein [Lachnospiraceae bacterium]|nr:tRNA-dihydrouridine synthase family protein [Lachnospiraceae bacterium]